jgi:hypothetical protein
MAGQIELNSRAALCRQLARHEPNSELYWLAEAENWSRLSRQPVEAVRNGQRDAFEQFLDLMAKEDVQT